MRLLTSISTINSLVSIIHWLDPKNPYKLFADLIIARSTGMIYFTYGYFYVPSENISIRRLAYMNTILMLSLFCKSCIENKYNNIWWEAYHIAFHLSVVFGKTLVLGNI